MSSDDLQFDASKVGVVRPYSSKEVVFKFKPTMAGPFQETVFVENLLDSSADTCITMKATVYKKSHFHVENICDSVVISPKTLHSTIGAFVLHNDSDKAREFLVEFEVVLLTFFCSGSKKVVGQTIIISNFGRFSKNCFSTARDSRCGTCCEEYAPRTNGYCGKLQEIYEQSTTFAIQDEGFGETTQQ